MLASPGGHRSHSHNHSMARGKKVKFPGRPGRATEQRAGHTLTVFKMVEIELGPDNTHNHEGVTIYCPLNMIVLQLIYTFGKRDV